MSLIDSNNLLPRLWDYISDADYEKVKKVISEMPSAEKMGKWIRHPIYSGSDHYYYACSECDYQSWSQDNYCSVCGAKMEVEDAETNF